MKERLSQNQNWKENYKFKFDSVCVIPYYSLTGKNVERDVNIY